jgi:phenylacetate-coenzyme A ligase PaaK-like adenylate-forming protein
MSTDERLADLLTRILRAPSQFYQRRLIDTGCTAVQDCRSDVLARLPLTRREEILRDQLDHLPHGTRRFADATLPVRAGSAGTGNSLLVLAWSAAELASERAAGTRLLGRLGIHAGMRVANTLPGALATPGALLLGDVIENIGALDVPLGAVDSPAAARQAWELVDRVQPAVIVVDRASAAPLLTAAPRRLRTWWEGVVWLQTGAGAPDVSAQLHAAGFAGWQRRWLAVPEVSSFVAHSCAASRFHVDEGVVAEVVDDATGAVLPADRDGTLALTCLHGEAPLLRYASGLRARRRPTPCPCGASGVAVELV